MTRAVVIPFTRYQPHVGNTYRVLWDGFLKMLPIWANEFDKLYIIDVDMEFNQEDARQLSIIKPNSVILPKEVDGHHWDQYKWVIPQIEEDNILFLDHDVVISRRGIVNEWFELKEKAGYSLVGSFDGSGGMALQMRKRFKILKGGFTRMGSYYFIIGKETLEKFKDVSFAPINYPVGTYIPELGYTTVEGDWSDSFGLLTIKLLDSGSACALEDPRGSIYFRNGKIEQDIKLPELDFGYYHIRNGNLPNYLAASRLANNMDDYWGQIKSNPGEVCRICAWVLWMSPDNLKPFFEGIMMDCGMTKEQIDEYMKAFITYHHLDGI